MGHGAGFRKIDAASRRPHRPSGIDPKDFSGFSYLLGDPQPWQRSKWGDDLDAARGIFIKLAPALPGVPPWASTLPPCVDIADNPFIPAGYTYLLQFVAHDLVQTSMPFWAAADLGVDSENCRDVGLMLDALYGGGPSACPAAFQSTDAMDENRFLLDLGGVAVTPGTTNASGACPFRDLARVNVAKNYTSNNGDSVNFDKAYLAGVADARNDDGIILTQLTVLLALAHNIIAGSIQSPKPEARFAYARGLMLLIYHAILRCDLLPRILHPAIWQMVKDRGAESRDWLWREPGLPLEFSHGAFRVGHVMVRDSYYLNDSLAVQPVPVRDIVTHNQPLQSPRFHGSQRTPLESDWILRWSRFFSLTGTPNFSRRIGPARSSLDLDQPDLFPIPGQTPPDGATLRDLLSAASARLWSVDALISTISARSPGLIPAGWMFANPSMRQSSIAAWLNGNTQGRLAASDVALISADPPLPLFVLLEAGLDPDPRLQGRCMGVLGSIIVAEVLCKRMAAERDRLDKLKVASQGALPAAMRTDVTGIDSMPALVNFVAKSGHLDTCATMPFI